MKLKSEDCAAIIYSHTSSPYSVQPTGYNHKPQSSAAVVQCQLNTVRHTLDFLNTAISPTSTTEVNPTQ